MRRGAGKLALRKSGAETLIGGDGGADGAIRNARRDGGSSRRAEQAALERFDVGRIRADQIGNAAGQNVAEDAEASSEDGARLELPGDGGSRLEDGEGRGRKEVGEMRLNGGIERLIDVVRDGVEGASQARDLAVRVQGIRIERVADAEGPRKLGRDLPRILRVEIEIQEIKGSFALSGKVSVAVEATP